MYEKHFRLEIGEAFYFRIEEMPASALGGFRAWVETEHGASVPAEENFATRDLALAWIGRQKESKLPGHICNAQCETA